MPKDYFSALLRTALLNNEHAMNQLHDGFMPLPTAEREKKNLKISGSHRQHSCAATLMKQVAAERLRLRRASLPPCLLKPFASAHSEGEWTGRFGARITNCPGGDGCHGQQRTVDKTRGLLRCIDQTKYLVKSKLPLVNFL